VRLVPKPEALALLDRERADLPARFAGCAMCGLAAGHAAGPGALAENEHAVAVLDRYATRRGHLLVVLRRHVEAVTDLGWDEYAGAQRLAWEGARALGRVLAPRRVFVAALGSSAPLPMTFAHHHVHAIPLHDGGEEDRPAAVFTWASGVYVYEPEEARELAAALRAAWGG
jgi:diadenosine tetraphosphate (Ap4A) HIT family hydrolase